MIDQQTWEKEYIYSMFPEKQYTDAFQIWVEYYYLIELFDRQCPGKPDDRVIWVILSEEDKIESNIYARTLGEKAFSVLWGLKINAEMNDEARKDAKRLSYEELLREYNHLPMYFLKG